MEKQVSKKEMESAISAVEVEREKIKGAKTLKEAIALIDQDLKNAKIALKDIEASEINLNPDFFETLTVKVPKLVMDFIRKIEDDPIKYIEFSTVDSVRADIESMKGEEWAEFFHLQPIFAEILNDSRYKKEK
jgi:hypothetical protein